MIKNMGLVLFWGSTFAASVSLSSEETITKPTQQPTDNTTPTDLFNSPAIGWTNSLYRPQNG